MRRPRGSRPVAGLRGCRPFPLRFRGETLTMDGQGPNSVVVVGASAGGVEALEVVAAGLPRDLPAPVAVVLHVSPRAESRLPQILSRAGPLPAFHAQDGEPLYPGRIYVAPPDRHLLFQDGRCAVVRGPREHHARPAIDPLFRSAAARFASRALGGRLAGR